MPEALKFKVGIPNSGLDAYGRERKPWVKPLKLSDFINYINNHPQWDNELKGELVKRISSYPVGALKHFYNNIDTHIEAIRRKKIEDENKRNEENVENNEKDTDKEAGQKEEIAS